MFWSTKSLGRSSITLMIISSVFLHTITISLKSSSTINASVSDYNQARRFPSWYPFRCFCLLAETFQIFHVDLVERSISPRHDLTLFVRDLVSAKLLSHWYDGPEGSQFSCKFSQFSCEFSQLSCDFWNSSVVIFETVQLWFFTVQLWFLKNVQLWFSALFNSDLLEQKLRPLHFIRHIRASKSRKGGSFRT